MLKLDITHIYYNVKIENLDQIAVKINTCGFKMIFNGKV